jgi:hypothetical protein
MSLARTVEAVDASTEGHRLAPAAARRVLQAPHRLSQAPGLFVRPRGALDVA